MIEWLSDCVGAFHWLRPWALPGVVLAAVVLVLGLRRTQDLQAPWRGMIDAHLLAHLLIKDEAVRRLKSIYLLALALACTAVALAGPSWQREPTPLVDDTAPLMLALDLSTLMNAVDATPTRLARAKLKIRRLLERRGKAPTGLLVYAGTAHLVLPPTVDRSLLDSYLDALTSELMPVLGQRPDVALALAREWLDRSTAVGSVLFMTGDAPAAALNAFVWHRRHSPHVIAVLALGSEQGGPVRGPTGDYLNDAKGVQLHARRDDAGLQALRDKAGAIVVASSTDERDLEALEGRIAVARVQAQADDPRARWRDEGLWLVWPALLSLLLLFRRGGSVRWQALPVAALACLALALVVPSGTAQAAEPVAGWIEHVLTPDQQGRWLLERQQPAAAATRFTDPLWRGTALAQAGDLAGAADAFALADSAAGWFNQAQMLARQQQFARAVAAYDQALQRAPGWAEALADRERILVLAQLAAAAAQAADEEDNQAVTSDDEPDAVEASERPHKAGVTPGLPMSEMQLAEQWLQSIDTSPADFLRRKFQVQAQAKAVGEAAR